ncbi:UDP-N-acetylmuramate dehydrogenase [Streptomyces halobius]|uniref:UDP-N-acetylmuramate dehydrogenase n=1 Tax=Streptomyces halobius TaxID=2879846 RepID=A0ABY4LZG5_9ACTN|nr:hypothetical protein [Streptomyces halobius]UQA90891.1 hypothetical protein K9S39_02465 [Streptomyces halobius]
MNERPEGGHGKRPEIRAMVHVYRAPAASDTHHAGVSDDCTTRSRLGQSLPAPPNASIGRLPDPDARPERRGLRPGDRRLPGRGGGLGLAVPAPCHSPGGRLRSLGHRTSVFKGSARWTLLSLVFALRRSALSASITYGKVAAELDILPRGRVPLDEAARAVLAVRRGKGMVLGCSDTDRRSVGSVFFSPVVTSAQAADLRAQDAPVSSFPDGSTRVSAGWLIQQAGFALGTPLSEGVGISSLHHTLVADDGGAGSFTEAIEIVQRQVLDHTGVRLTPEIDFLGDGDGDGDGNPLPGS